MLLKICSHPVQSRSSKLSQLPKQPWLLWSLLAILLVWGYKELQVFTTQPDAIFVLGGHEERERFAAQLAQKHPDLPIWVSSGSPQGYVERIFERNHIPRDRLHLDYRAVDTVTNFTTVVEELKARGIESVYLVTSQNHLRRARIIGEVVFGSRGITIKPLAVPSHSPPEPLRKCLRDGARAIYWLATGQTGTHWYQRWQIGDRQTR
ncbi:MAG: YdcF family protein [Chloroflexaceae bacterium]|nr:YdcF family protein [Chloroflexaceae bacterium]